MGKSSVRKEWSCAGKEWPSLGSAYGRVWWVPTTTALTLALTDSKMAKGKVCRCKGDSPGRSCPKKNDDSDKLATCVNRSADQSDRLPREPWLCVQDT